MKGLVFGDLRAKQRAFDSQLDELTLKVYKAHTAAISPNATANDKQLKTDLTMNLSMKQESDLWKAVGRLERYRKRRDELASKS
jgi:hypothetical protein